MKPHGADRLELEPAGTLRLVCPSPKGWSGRRAKTHLTPEFPGTAVRWEEGLFEVLEAIPRVDGGIVYRLAPWERHHTARGVSSYDEASEAARLRDAARLRADLALRRLGLLLSPLLGHLPAAAQRQLERERGLPARTLTIASALPLLVLGVLGAFDFLIATAGGGTFLSGLAAPSLPIALFLFLESAARLAAAFLHGEPMGSLAGALGYELWRRATGRGLPPSRRYAGHSSAEAPEPGKEIR